MADEDLLTKAQGLSDLELAFLVSLMSREHCIITAHPSALDDLLEELQLVAAKTFGLNSVIIDCHPNTSLDDFVSALLLSNQQPPSRTPSPFLARADSYFHSHPRGTGTSGLAPLSPINPPISPTAPTVPGGPSLGAVSGTGAYHAPAASFSIAEVVLARNLDRAPKAVQIQALELLRTRRVFTRTAVQTAPKTFLFVPVLATGRGQNGRRATMGVTPHLNDLFFISHYHDLEDGFAHLEEGLDVSEDVETASTESVVVVKKPIGGDTKVDSLFSEVDISRLSELSQNVKIDIDVLRYQMNIVSFLRMHRAFARGASPTATKHFDRLVRCLAPLHKVDYVTPALVALAARKIYLHRIEITEPEHERSVQWGSKLRAVEALLEDVGPEDLIEDVIGMVAPPL